MTTFKELGLSKEVLKVLSEIGFEKPSEIQAQAIPQLIEGFEDFIGLAQTGTGKTAAFGLPLLERIDPDSQDTQALILAPTRELGQQIAEQLNIYGKYLKRINILAVYGGAAITNQIKALKKPQHIIIATPGRLIDLIKRKSVKLNNLQYLVLDEADEMLNMGFKDELDKILSYTPEEKSTWLFSATMPNEIKSMVDTYMDDPVEVKIDRKNTVNTNIEHKFVLVRSIDKTEALTRFLDMTPEMVGVVFCRTKRETQSLAEELQRRRYQVDALHGDMSQAQRDRVMRRFKAHHLKVLIATDVAARGIDVQDVTHVFHHSLPDNNEYYTHRSGRTARAGKEGLSIAFINGREKYKVRSLEKQLGITFKHMLIPNQNDISKIRLENWALDVLQHSSKSQADDHIRENAIMLFGNLSKEELIGKLIARELGQLNLDEGRDLNVPLKEKRGNHPQKRRNNDFQRNGNRNGNGRRNSRNGNGYPEGRKRRRPRRKTAKS
ncbi:MAG: DEAD/DEAH box helicase [Bacteroidia bacterium]|nr:DEAD/DEAH box helicase [Bacteroidia bacterium]